MNTYKYNEPSPPPQFGPIPEGDYNFTVIEAGEPYHSAAGNFVLAVKLQVGPEKAHVYDNPWAGDNGDKIAQFLKACGRAPAIGQEPAWNKLIGAKGRCHIKIETAQQGKLAGKPVNKVSWYIFATDVLPSRPNATSTCVLPKLLVDGDQTPDDIPF